MGHRQFQAASLEYLLQHEVESSGGAAAEDQDGDYEATVLELTLAKLLIEL